MEPLRRQAYVGSIAQQQRGVVLLIALIMLIAMTLAGLALIRTVDTASLIAGNVAFQQSSVMSSDAGVEYAAAELVASAANSVTTKLPFDLNGTSYSGNTVPGATQGFYSNGLIPQYFGPIPNTTIDTWDKWWSDLQSRSLTKVVPTANANNADAAGNTVSYVIHRLCDSPLTVNDVNNHCAVTPSGSGGGSSQQAGVMALTGVPQVYFRITVRTTGPRGTSSLVQALVAM